MTIEEIKKDLEDPKVRLKYIKLQGIGLVILI